MSRYSSTLGKRYVGNWMFILLVIGSMDQNYNNNLPGLRKGNTEFIAFALRVKYRKFVANRIRKQNWYGKVGGKGIMEVAEKLKTVSLVGLFIEAQFNSMPSNFCKEHFGKMYPPVNVCFGGSCWRRYREYVEKGTRDGR